MIQDIWIWVWMGDSEKADPTLCPSAFGFDNPEWRLRGDQIDYRVNHLLLSDNLCDLSHLDFVHETTLGLVTGGGWSAKLPRIIQLERGLRFERWHVGRRTSPSNPTLLDTWSTYNYSVPGIFVMENMSFPHGMALDVDYGAPTAEPLMHRVEQQAVTPIDPENTPYFFATGFKSDLPEEVLEPVFEIVKPAFCEDRAMIEAQQSIWDVTDQNRPMAFIEHDKAPAMFRRTLERLIKAEMSEAVISKVGKVTNQTADVA